MICLYYDPETEIPDGGHAGVRRRYVEWVESRLNGIFQDAEELKQEQERINDHIEKVNSVENPHFGSI